MAAAGDAELVKNALAEVAPEIDPASLDPAASLRDGADLDSMDYLAFVATIAEALGIDIPEDDYSMLDGLDRAAEYVAQRRG